MNKELEFETYLSITPDKFSIYLFDVKNLKNLYSKELKLKENLNFINSNILKDFLDNNIFKVEKIAGKFVETIILIIENNNILNLHLGIKKKNYDSYINKKQLEIFLTDAKDLFKENYQNEKIMHMIINKYLINGKKYPSMQNQIKCNYLGLEIKFISISNNFINDLNKVLENYQININKCLDKNYIQSFFVNKNIEISEMAHNIINGINENEVKVVPKKSKKSGFFEKFFQLLS